ncbi:MAG: dicarboxylate/amino acid:cation symporter [Syntrophaceticus sp.]
MEKLYPRSLIHLTRHLQGLIQGKLWLKILISMFLGLVVGLILSPHTGLVSPKAAEVFGSWLALPGNIFLGLIQMIVIPLILASIIRGMAASEDLEHLRQLGLRLVFYLTITTIVAITIGIGVTTVLQPGQFIDQSLVTSVVETAPAESQEGITETPELEAFPDIVISLFPENPLGSMMKGEMLQVVLFSLIIGFALVTMVSNHAKPLLELLGSIQEVCMTVVRWAMYLAPLAVFGLLAQITIKVGFEALLGMAAYVGTVLLALLLLLCFYLLIVFFVSGKSPLAFMGAIREAQLLAFSTSSSAAVMPLSLKTAKEKLKVRPSISEFVIPLGTTINMDGTALYQGAATVFLAQVFGIELGLSALVLIVVTTVAASLGTPATPGVGIVILSLVLESAGIPTAGIALILGVDRILDMSRTVLNVTGDFTACLVMDRWVGGSKTFEEELSEEEEREKKRAETGEDVIYNVG